MKTGFHTRFFYFISAAKLTLFASLRYKQLSCRNQNFCYDCAVFQQPAETPLALHFYAAKACV